jgi:hypothetical protein
MRNGSPAGTWVLREIFSLPSFEEIFDGHFRRDFGRVPDKVGAGGIKFETHAVDFFVTRV